MPVLIRVPSQPGQLGELSNLNLCRCLRYAMADEKVRNIIVHLLLRFCGKQNRIGIGSLSVFFFYKEEALFSIST